MGRKRFTSIKEVVDNDTSYMPGRKIYPAAFMNSMPIRHIAENEWFDVLSSPHYNPVDEYPLGVDIHEGEIGHDYGWRYILPMRKM